MTFFKRLIDRLKTPAKPSKVTSKSSRSATVELGRTAGGRVMVVDVPDPHPPIAPIPLTSTDIEARIRCADHPVVVEICGLMGDVCVTEPLLERIRETCRVQSLGLIRTDSSELLGDNKTKPTVIVYGHGREIERFRGQISVDAIVRCIEGITTSDSA